MGDQVDPKKDPSKVVILALARCVCPIRNGWKTQAIQLPQQAVLSEFFNSSSGSDVEGSSHMLYIQRMRIHFFKEFEAEHEAVLEAQRKVSETEFNEFNRNRDNSIS